MIISKLKKILTWTLAVIICGNFLLLTTPIQRVKADDSAFKFDPNTKKLVKGSLPTYYKLLKDTTTMSYQGVEKSTSLQEFVFRSDQNPNIYVAVKDGTLINYVFDASVPGGNWADASATITDVIEPFNTKVLFPPKYYVINPKCVDEAGKPVEGLTVQARLSGFGPIMAEGKSVTDAEGNTHFDATSPPNYFWPDPSVQGFELIAFDDSTESGTKNADGKYWLGQLSLNTSSDFKQGTASDRYIANKDMMIVVKGVDTPPKELTKSITEQVVQTITGGSSNCETQFKCGSWNPFSGAICKAQCAVIDGISAVLAWVMKEVLYPSLGLEDAAKNVKQPPGANSGSGNTNTNTPATNTNAPVDNSIDQGI